MKNIALDLPITSESLAVFVHTTYIVQVQAINCVVRVFCKIGYFAGKNKLVLGQ